MISFFKKDFLNELWLDFEKLLNIKNDEYDFNIMPISGLLVSNLSKNDFFKIINNFNRSKVRFNSSCSS